MSTIENVISTYTVKNQVEQVSLRTEVSVESGNLTKTKTTATIDNMPIGGYENDKIRKMANIIFTSSLQDSNHAVIAQVLIAEAERAVAEVLQVIPPKSTEEQQ